MPELDNIETLVDASSDVGSFVGHASPSIGQSPMQPYGTTDPMPTNTLVDRRTNTPFGTYTEDEIKEAVVKAVTTDTVFDPESNPGDRVFKDAQAQADPRYANFQANILEVMGTHYTYMDLMSKANIAMSKVKSVDDTDYLEEAERLYGEATTERQKNPEEYPDHDLFHEMMRASSEGVATMVNIGQEAAPGVAMDAATGAWYGSFLGLLGGPNPMTVGSGAVAGMGVALSSSIPARMFEATYKMGKGELMFQMLKPPEGEEPIPIVIAEPLAEKAAYAYAALELTGEIGVIINTFGLAANIGQRIIGIAGEGGTEFAQTILEQITSHLGRKELARVQGKEFTETIDDVLDFVEAKKAARQSILATAGMGAPSAVVQIPTDTVRFLRDKKKQQDTKVIEKVNKAVRAANTATVNEVADKPTVTTVNPVTNTLVEATPIHPAEVGVVKNDTVLKGTDITESELDNLAVLDDDSIDSAIDEIDNRLYESLDDKASIFFAGIADFLNNDEETKAVETLTAARAQSAGMSLSQYVEHHGLEFENTGEENADLNATITFTEDNRTIIKAFSNGNMSSIVHELGHVFRRDLQGEDRNIADDFVGIERGAVWDTRAEEKFARGWENYLATGQAPTPELQNIFTKLHAWMLNIYKAIVGSDIDVEITPEMRGVFDRLLVVSEVAKNNASVLKDDAAIGEQTLEQKRRLEDNDADAILRIKKERLAIERANKAYKERLAEIAAKRGSLKETVKDQKKALIQAMRDMFDSGDLHGYRMARNQMKAFLSRERNRYASQRKHKAIRKSIIKKLKRGLPSSSFGKKFVKINPELAQVLRDVLDVLGTAKTNAQIKELYMSRIGSGFGQHDMVTDPTNYIINRYLDGAVSRNSAGVTILKELNTELRDLIKGETKNSPMMKLKAEVDAIIPDIVNDINGGNVVDTDVADTDRAHKERQKEKSVRERIATSTLGKYAVMGFNTMIHRVTSYSSDTVSSLEKITNFFQAKQGKMTQIARATKWINGAYKAIYGIDSAAKMNKQMRLDNQQDLDVGAGVRFSRSELRQLYMYMQDETLTNKLVSMFGGINKYVDIYDNVDVVLTQQDKDFATALMQYFGSDEQYNRTNKVYKSVYGVDLGRLRNYVPIRSQHYLNLDEQLTAAEKYTQFQHDQDARKTETSARSIRERTDNVHQLHLQGDLSLYSSFNEEMAHFVNFAEQGRKVRMILDDKRVRRAIEVEYGPTMYKYIMSALDDVLADGINNRNQYPIIDRFRAAFVRSTIGASTSVFLKQQISIVQGIQHMPAGQYFKGLVKFWINPITNITEMMGTEYLWNRRSLVDRDLKSVLSSATYSKWKLNPTYANWLTMNVTVGDSLAIAQAGWVLKNYFVTQTNPDTGVNYTPKEAWKHVSALMEGTQQSGMMQELSQVQRAGSYAALFTMYSTGPVQALRQEVEAAKDYFAGKITGRQLAKTVFIYHILVPSLYAAAASAISGDDWDESIKSQLIAITLGPFGAAYATGAVVAEAFRRIAGLQRYSVDGIFEDIVNDVSKITAKMAEGNTDDLTFDDWMGALQAVTVVSGHGVPVQRLTRTVENIAEGDVPGAIFSKNPNRN